MKVREPVVAGMFYPEEKEQLNNDLKILFDNEDTIKVNNVFGLVAPHAGYIYSGKTAAKCYSRITADSFDKVIVISPSHREYFYGCSIYSGDAYETPLGIINVDEELSQKLIDNGEHIYRGEAGHNLEHALEVHLPFLQFIKTDFTLVPLVMGSQTKETITDLANALAKIYDEKTLIVASSDLSHFYSKEKANQIDSIIQNHIEEFNHWKLFDDIENKNCEACGAGPIISLMEAASILERTSSEIVDYTDSSEASGDQSEVVGYLSALIY